MAQIQERVRRARHQGDQRPRRHRDRVDRVQARPRSRVRSVRGQEECAAPRADRAGATDVTNILRGGKLSIRDTVIEELERAYGVAAVTEGLERYERFLSGADRPRIGNAGAYLRTIIANKAREDGSTGQGAEPEKSAHVVVESKAAPAVLRFAP